MTNRTYIDLLNTFIDIEVDKKLKENKVLTFQFFSSEELKAQVRQSTPFFNDEKFDDLYAIAIKEAKHRNKQGMTPSISISTQETKNKKWLTDERIKSLGWNNDEIITYRARYLKYLKNLERSELYIQETARSSQEIIKKLGDPHSENPYFTRGLVVGSVQSGKTANFNAVINSALDVGYDLIIVLSGIMEDLREQTQKRIEKEVVGTNIGGEWNGVGKVSSFGTRGSHPEVNQVCIPTSAKTDFKKNMKEADFDLNHKNILVCKKNTGVLKNLLLWLDKYLNENKDKIDIPFLIIDDEADNASLNNLGHKGIEYASIINGQIRALLALFNKKTYLGYTATPFANVLQDRNEKPKEKLEIKENGEIKSFEQEGSLFPKDFIELLFPPDNYIGAKHFFETRLNKIKKIDPLIPSAINDYLDYFPDRITINDMQPTKKIGKGTRATKRDDGFPKRDQLPDSLKDAIKCFVISTAIRTSREKEMFQSKLFQPHNTMLIHISRFTPWQTRTKENVDKYVNELTSALENDSPSDKKGIYVDFEKIWNKYYAYIMENIRTYLPDDYEDDFLTPRTFHDIKPLLYKAISDIEVKAINSETKDKLDYPEDKPKKYIAIGGNRLSRGFTLEGLTINYFIRNTNFADTLLQMGRWFGYRPGYIDCCKVFVTQDGIEKFDQTTATIEDLEDKFIEMNRDPNNTPANFALRVLSHPGVIQITRGDILKNAKEIKWSYSDHLKQFTKFHIDNKKINEAWEAFVSHISSPDIHFEIKYNEENKPEFLEYQPETIDKLFDFLNLPNSFYERNNDLSGIKEYIKLCSKENKLNKWSIVIKVTGRGGVLESNVSGLPIEIHKAERKSSTSKKWHDMLKNEHIFAAGGGSSNILGGGQDMQIRLNDAQIKQANKEFKDQLRKELKEKYPNISDITLEEKVKQTSVPEKAFRRMMSDEEGILLIYLMDLESIFSDEHGPIVELDELKKSIDTNIPLIGYAIGIPKIDSNIGGTYLESLFHKDINEEYNEDEEYNEIKEELEG